MIQELAWPSCPYPGCVMGGERCGSPQTWGSAQAYKELGPVRIMSLPASGAWALGGDRRSGLVCFCGFANTCRSAWLDVVSATPLAEGACWGVDLRVHLT